MRRAEARAPGWSRLLLRLRPLGNRRHEIAADLDELFVKRTATVGSRAARRRYLRDVLSLWIRRAPGPRPGGREPHGRSRGPARWLSDLADDLRYGTRVFRRQPALVGLALAGLAVAMGIATAAFTYAESTFLRPTMAVPDRDSVVRVIEVLPRAGLDLDDIPLEVYRALRERSTTIRAEASYRSSARLDDQAAGLVDLPLRVTFVSATFLQTFGAQAAAGRLLGPADAEADAPPAAVLLHPRWRVTFGGDPSVVGRKVDLNGVPFTIVGVADQGFGGPFRFDDVPDLFVSFSAIPLIVDADRLARNRGVAKVGCDVVGRLASGATVEQADAEMRAIGVSAGFDPDDPERPRALAVRPAGAMLDGDVLGLLAVVAVVVSLVVLLAAANVATLLLAGTTTRRQEIAARLALGASPVRILRQLLTESLLVAVVAGLAGVLAASWLTTAGARLFGASPLLELTPGWAVIAMIGVAALAVGLVAGLGPARHAVRGGMSGILKGSANAVAAGSVGRLRSSFIGLQAAASILLLVLTALFTRALVEASAIDLPFDPARLVAVDVTSYGDAESLPRDAFWAEAVDRVLGLPGVEAASVADLSPLGLVQTSGTSLRGIDYQVLVGHVDERFFEATGTRLLSGRTFTADEIARRAPVIVVSERYARDFWPGENPIGRNPSDVAHQPSGEVIGVVEDVPWSVDRPRNFGAASMFRPIDERARLQLLVRVADTASTLDPLREAVTAIDPTRRVRLSLTSDHFASSLRLHATLASMAATVGGLALVLAVIGLFGVTAFVVGLRRREIGIRLAIGAGRRDVVALVFRQGMRPVLIGLAVGLVLAMVAAQVLTEILTGGVSPRDPLALSSAVAMLLIAAGIGVLVPARRVLAIEPSEVLRDQ